jgi:Ras-related GTP-binding protein A/B
MFFITRLTENTNLAASIPPSEQVFNAARVNIMLARSKFAELDIANRPRPALQQAFASVPGTGMDGDGENGGSRGEGEFGG